MSKYECVILAADGSKTHTIREASSREDVLSLYVGSGLYLLSIRPIRDSWGRKSRMHVRKGDVLSFTEIMATLLRSGLSVQHALEIFQGIAARPASIQLAKSILGAIRSGDSLFTALCRYDSVFSPLYLAMIKIGEKTGSVDGVLKILSDYLKLLQAIRGKIRNALIYPAIVLVLAIAGSFGIALYVAPRMMEILSVFQSDAQGARMDAVVPGFSMLSALIVFNISFVFLLILLIILRKKISSISLFFDGFLLKIPGVGLVITHYETLNFSFAMEMLVKSGFSLPEALRESIICVGNLAYRQSLRRILDSLERGNKLSDSFLLEKNVPSHVGMWLAVAEETGSVPVVFTQIRSYFQSGLEDATGKIVTTIEPLAILVVGLIVMALVIQFVLPVFAMYGKVL